MISALDRIAQLMAIPECSEEEWREMCAITEAAAEGLKLPPNWKRDPITEGHPRGYSRADGLHVLVSGGRWPDGKRWLHVSLAFRNRIPTYWDLADVKRLFVGDDRQAIQVFPATGRHVNLHNYCLHLWACLDGDGLPDFGRHGTI